MALTELSKKYWAPVHQVTDYISSIIKKDDKVLEVGPGRAPFKRANAYVDFVDIKGIDIIKRDLNTQSLPFEDKSFDFVYCRHVIEDMWNPINLLREMSRVGKAGFIETPSPIAELGRGVDGACPPFRGYHHHRWIVWVFGSELRLVSKYPLVEYLRLDEPKIDEWLKTEKYWNTYHLWDGDINFVHRQSPLDFDIPTSYLGIVNEAMERSREATDIFFSIMRGA